jgi:hypothetical protein
MPIVGREQIELEVLRALMGHVRAIDHHAQAEVSRGNGEVVEEAR